MTSALFDITADLIEPHAVVATKDALTTAHVHWTAVESMILEKHYAGRMPSITKAFGLFDDTGIIGGLTIGKPASPPLCIGLAGPEYSNQVYELNRLILTAQLERNVLSWFVGSALKSLAQSDMIIVSFADDGVGHHGYIYQATNWVYTGKSTERTDKYMPGGKHPRHYTEEYVHLRKLRTAKHRYLYVPNRRLRKRVMRDLRYPIMPYPKGDNRRYTLGQTVRDVVLDTRTGRTYLDGGTQ